MGGGLHLLGQHFSSLESLTLCARADVNVLKSTLPFASRWVRFQWNQHLPYSVLSCATV